MSSDYAYDEQAQFFPFFILTISTLVTVPLTYTLFRSGTDLESNAARIETSFRPDDHDIIITQRRKQWRRERPTKLLIFTFLGYALIAYMIYLIIVTARITPTIWNPYEILGLSMSATEKQIKSKFRKLTLQFHPDKVRITPDMNLTAQEITEKYVDISKAYKALTDEDVRQNYLLYGHPDGKQSMSIGIALPKLIVEQGSGKYVLLVYGVLLGVLLPYIVGKWWYGTQALTRDGVLIQSAGRLFREYKEDMSSGSVVNALSAADEYESVLQGPRVDAGLSKIEAKVDAAASQMYGFDVREQKGLKNLDGLQRKTLALLWAYLGRIKLDDPELEAEKYEIAPHAFQLNRSFMSVVLAYGAAQPLLATLGASQRLIQALTPGASPLMQLPHVTPSLAAFMAKHPRGAATIEQFMALDDAERKKRVLGSFIKQPAYRYEEMVKVARQIPHVKLDKAFFKCVGEKLIVVSSLVEFVVKFRVIPPGSVNVPAVKPEDLEDPDPEEDDVESLIGRKDATTSSSKKTAAKKKANTESTQPPLAYAPYFARDHSPRWHLFLTDPAEQRIAVPPNSFTTFGEPIFNEDGSPTYNVQTWKMSFQAPPQANTYLFTMWLICDSYVGMDSKMPVQLVVEETAKAEEIESEEEISEPDEDSLAGQMNALKQGGLGSPTSTSPPKPKKIKAKKIEEDVDDESDTEGDEDWTSETDTETDED